MLGNGIQRGLEQGIKPAAEAVRAAFDSRADLWGSYGARLYYSKQEDLEHAMTINYGLRACVEAVPAALEPGCYAYTLRLRVSTACTRVFDRSLRQMGSFPSSLRLTFELQPSSIIISVAGKSRAFCFVLRTRDNNSRQTRLLRYASTARSWLTSCPSWRNDARTRGRRRINARAKHDRWDVAEPVSRDQRLLKTSDTVETRTTFR